VFCLHVVSSVLAIMYLITLHTDNTGNQHVCKIFPFCFVGACSFVSFLHVLYCILSEPSWLSHKKELYLAQGEIYTKWPLHSKSNDNKTGHQIYSPELEHLSLPEYVVFNGKTERRRFHWVIDLDLSFRFILRCPFRLFVCML
jgi:hypothetical protein